MQITGIWADLFKVSEGKHTLCWLGLQGGKYVLLPTEWMELNFDEGSLDKAKVRAENALTWEPAIGRSLPVPIGNSPEGDSPEGDPPWL